MKSDRFDSWTIILVTVFIAALTVMFLSWFMMGCNHSYDDPNRPCVTNSDCDPGYRCDVISNNCEVIIYGADASEATDSGTMIETDSSVPVITTDSNTPEDAGSSPGGSDAGEPGTDSGTDAGPPDDSGTGYNPLPCSAPGCGYCWEGTAFFWNCPDSWNGGGDLCDCGCQFFDTDCVGS